MRNTANMLFDCIKSAVTGAEMMGFVPEMTGDVYALAKSHDMAHLVAEALDAAGISAPDECVPLLQRARLTAVFRAEQMDEALATLKKVLSAADIPFLPLKGAVIRDLYPTRWQRTSCDIDVLVKEEHLTVAAETLAKEGGFTLGGKGAHDLSLYSAAGVHIELHYTLVEDHIPLAVQRILNTVWAHTEGDGAERVMTSDFLYFYHIAHMAKHFMLGGCGIRPLLDLWLLHKLSPPTAAAVALLEEGGLAIFANAAVRLAAVWFEGGAHDNLTVRMEAFILHGGVYGTLQNQIAVEQKKKGRLGYLLSKIFLRYSRLKYQYPVIQRHKWLTPVCHLRRWCRLLFGGEWRRVRHTLRVNQGLSSESVRAAGALFEELSL